MNVISQLGAKHMVCIFSCRRMAQTLGSSRVHSTDVLSSHRSNLRNLKWVFKKYPRQDEQYHEIPRSEMSSAASIVSSTCGPAGKATSESQHLLDHVHCLYRHACRSTLTRPKLLLNSAWPMRISVFNHSAESTMAS